MSVEDIDFSNNKHKLTSPRSKEACLRLGIQIKDLYFKDFQQFKADNPNIITLSKDAQNLRWEHYEESRQELIDMIKNEKNNIINEQMNESSKELEKKVKYIICL